MSVPVSDPAPLDRPVRTLYGVDEAYRTFPAEELPPGFSALWTIVPLIANLVEEVRSRRIIEVGSWEGASAILMAMVAQETGVACEEIICVDTWLGSPELLLGRDETTPWLPGRNVPNLRLVHGYPTIHATFVANVIGFGFQDLITPLPLPSNQASVVLRRLGVTADLIYIDGAHDEDSVRRDIEGFWPLLEPGGVLFGDDYNWPSVRRAVGSFVREKNLVVEAVQWKFILRKAK